MAGSECGAEVSEVALAARLLQRLQELQCTSVEGLYLTEPENMLELLCTPSIHRLDILEWICTRIQPPLRDRFSLLKESQIDVKIKAMAEMGFQLMLCRADDLDLIKGLATPRRQLSFMEELVDVIQSPWCSSEATPASAEESFLSCVRENEELLKEMYCSPHFLPMRTPEVNPWPSDIKPLLLGEEPLQKSRNLVAAKLKDANSEEFLKMLKETSSTLEELKQECSFLGSDNVPDSSSTVVQTVKLAMSDFLQLTNTFSQVYESEFQAHCSRSAPQISNCGSFFQAVHRSLSIFSKELQAIAQFTDTSARVVEVVCEREKQPWGNSSLMTLASKIEQLRRKYENFHAALQR